MSLLIDSSIWIDYFNSTITPETDLLHKILGCEQIVTGDLILTKVLQGFRHQRDFNRAKSTMMKFQVMPMVGSQIALQSAANYRFLLAKGITIRKTIDCLIATFCIEKNISLLHHDRDFDPFEKHLALSVRHP